MFFEKNRLGISSKAYFPGFYFVLCLLIGLFISPSVFARTASISTSGTVNIDIMPSRDGTTGTSVNTSEVNVVTNCRAGYNLSISGPTDRNLYRNGDSTNNTEGQYFTPVDGTSILKNTTNAWGYSLTASSDSDVFTPLSNTPALLRTTAQTASETDIDDDITIYYGVSVSNSLNPGTYEMANNGSIVYQLTMDPSCIDYEVIFNPNGGTGTMANQTIIVNDNTKLTGNSFTAPAMGTSYQNANGTTIPATANKLWTFWGWNTAADGTGDWYKDRESVANLANQGETITLYAQWKQPTLADLTTTTPIGTEKTIDHNTMQDMSAAACWNSDKFTAIGTPYGQTTLTDNRDGVTRSYTVARLPDGYCWMTQNLNLGTSTSITLTSDDTDLEEGTTFTLPASNPNDFSTSSAESNCNKATVYNDVTIPDYTVNSTTYSGKVTGYYSFAAATANTNTYSTTSDRVIFSNSICPKNWDLPSSTQYSELKTKGRVSTYNNTSASYTGKNAGNEPYYFVYGGYRKATGSAVNATNFYNPSSEGYLWMANNSSGTMGKYTKINTNGIADVGTGAESLYSFGGATYKYYGLGVRCISNMDQASYSITFINTDNNDTQIKKVVIGETGTIFSNLVFSRTNYRIIGWDTDSAGTNVVYALNQTITPSSDITLYTVWAPTYTLQYDGNGADAGVMTNVKHTNVAGGDVFDLFASNFSKTNYGFAGWSFDQNAQPGGASRIYGPNETITAPAGVSGETKTLYAVWVQSAGNLQDWNGCASMSAGAVTALKDTRDNNVYTVGKLADGNCWMMENLRLDTAGSSDSTKSQGFGWTFTGLADPETTNFSNSTTANTLYSTSNITGDNRGYRFPRYNNTNTSARSASPSITDNRIINSSAHSTIGGNLYSYGNYYSFASSMANTWDFTTADTSESAGTSICPSGWKLPYGNTTGNGNTNGGYYYLGDRLGATASNEASSRIWRAYPNNYVYSGGTNGSRGSSGNYWSSTAYSGTAANKIYIGTTSISYGNDSKYYGYSVRCIAAQGLEIKLMLNDGTGGVSGRAYGEAGSTVTLPTRITRENYRFTSWNTAANGSGTSYTDSYVLATAGVTLYAQWEPAFTLQYDGNGADAGVMTNVKHTNVAGGDVFDLFAPNYSKTNYGFAGWSFDQNAQPGGVSKIYGPSETIVAPATTTPGEMKTLYAIWVQSAGDLQNWNGCSSMNIGDVTALKDTRDNNVYTVGKLADGHCWMLENLRLDAANSLDSSKAQGFGGVFAGLANSESNNQFGGTSSNSLYTTDSSSTTLNIITGGHQAQRFPRYNNQNTNSRATNPTITDDRSTATSAYSAKLDTYIYSYGNYYSWAAAMANTKEMDSNYSSHSSGTSICPAGWRLPRAGLKDNINNNTHDFYLLSLAVIGAAPSDYDSDDSPEWSNHDGSKEGTNASMALRTYPNNFVNAGSGSFKGSGVHLWTSTARDIYGTPPYNNYYYAHIYSIYSTSVFPTQMNGKIYGETIRCMLADGLEITLMANDGTNKVNGRVYGDAGSTVTLASPTRTGYTFNSWNTAADGSGTSYTNSYTFDAQATTGITLYAQWTINQ